jgi:hypothetical protein
MRVETARGPDLPKGCFQGSKTYTFDAKFLTTPAVAILSQVAIHHSRRLMCLVYSTLVPKDFPTNFTRTVPSRHSPMSLKRLPMLVSSAWLRSSWKPVTRLPGCTTLWIWTCIDEHIRSGRICNRRRTEIPISGRLSDPLLSS